MSIFVKCKEKFPEAWALYLSCGTCKEVNFKHKCSTGT